MNENTDQSLPNSSIETLSDTNTKPVYKIKNKLVSGRLWLTIIAGLSFLMFVGTMCYVVVCKRDSITTSEISSTLNVLLLIISNVMTFYFTKNRDDINSNAVNETIGKLILKRSESNENKKD